MMSYPGEFPLDETAQVEASLVLKDTDYSDVLSTMSSLLQVGPNVISGLLDDLALKAKPLMKEGEKFINLHFGLEVFPDESSGVCVFVITCEGSKKYGTLTLKYDPQGENRRKEVRVRTGSRDVLRFGDMSSEPIVADTEAAVIDRLDSLRNGDDEIESGASPMFQVIEDGRVDTSTKDPQARFRYLMDRSAGAEE
jgi:hypothetical protein